MLPTKPIIHVIIMAVLNAVIQKGCSVQTHLLHTAYGDITYWQHRPQAAQETVVLLHGAAMNHAMFALQYQAWAEKYRVIVWDMPLHGASKPFMPVGMLQMARFLEDIAEQEQLTSVHVVGQSMGGMVAQYWAQIAPNRIKSLSLIDSIPLSPRYRGKLDSWALKTLPFFTKLSFKPQAIPKMAAKIATTAAAQSYVVKRFAELNKAELAQIMQIMVDGINSAENMVLNMPVQLLVGEQDGMGKVKAYNRAWHEQERLPLYMVNGAGHNSNMDKPQEVNTLLEAWIQRASYQMKA